MSNVSYYFEMVKKARLAHIAPKIANYVKYRFLNRAVVQSVKRYSPQIGAILLTKRCNLNCKYCNAAEYMNSDKSNWFSSEASLEKIQRIFTNPLFSKCILVDLLGGEPLLVKDLDRIIAYLTQRGHITNMSTNGVLLASRINELKHAGISRINVSLYDTNRSVLERDLFGINKVFPVHASIVLLRSDVEERSEKILENAHFLRSAGCRSLRFFMYRPMGVNPQVSEIIDDDLPSYLGLKKKMNHALPGFCVWPAAVKAQPKKVCPQLWQRVGCDAAGNMGICCGIDSSLTGANSNLFDADPDVIYNHPTIVAMRKQLLDSTSGPPAACKTCNLLGDPGW